VKRRLGLLVAGSLTLWLLVAYPARLLWGDSAAVYSAVALVLCLVPTALTLAWSTWAMSQAPEQQLVSVLGGSGVRMFAVLGTAWALSSAQPFFQQQSFWVWILAFYLVTLALEMVLLLAGRSVTANPEK
jgi:hypothetical protein